MRLRPRTLLTCALVVVAACGGGGDASSESTSADGAAPQGAPGSAGAVADFTAEDLAAYERGLAREIELVKAAQAASFTASTPEARGAAMQAQFETATMPEGAKVSGLGERYEGIREVVHTTLRTLDMQGKIDGPVSIDTARASAETKARLAKDPMAELPAGAAAALRARLDVIAAQWAEYTRLTAVGG
ncbi:MAG TPA: hypothetical protein VFT96_02965 [Gemmatimonadaceae bacterium]|nr:hypothetical protein [Gemmatimonadaceae bacterium]